jgi:hypothetical protein
VDVTRQESNEQKQESRLRIRRERWQLPVDVLGRGQRKSGLLENNILSGKEDNL